MTTRFSASASASASGPDRVAAIVAWLGSAECRDLDDADMIAGVAGRLRACGLPLDRLVLHLRTLHPDVLCRAVVWAPGRPVEVYDRDFGIEFSADFAGSPVRRVMESGHPLTVHPGRGVAPDWTWPEVFRGHGLTELFIAPLSGTEGAVRAASFCSAQPMGFAAAERDILARILPALREVCDRRFRTD